MNLNPDSWLARDMALNGDHGQVDPAYEAMCADLDAAEDFPPEGWDAELERARREALRATDPF